MPSRDLRAAYGEPSEAQLLRGRILSLGQVCALDGLERTLVD